MADCGWVSVLTNPAGNLARGDRFRANLAQGEHHLFATRRIWGELFATRQICRVDSFWGGFGFANLTEQWKFVARPGGGRPIDSGRRIRTVFSPEAPASGLFISGAVNDGSQASVFRHPADR
jgi:hypothetical protein